MNGIYIQLTSVLLTSVLVLSGCKPDESMKIIHRPALEIRHADRHLADGDWLRVKAPKRSDDVSRRVPLTLTNTGTGPLKIYMIEVLGSHADAIRLVTENRPTPSHPIVLAAVKDGAVGDDHKIELEAPTIPQDLNVQLKVKTNADPRGKNVHIIDVVIEAAKPTLIATPNPVDFGMEIEAQQHLTRHAKFVNTGDEAMEITGFQFVGDKGFSLQLEGTRWSIDASEINKGLTLKEKVILQPGQHMSVPVHYTALHDGPAGARLTVFSTDPAYPDGLGVRVNANGGNGVCPSPAIKVTEGTEVCPQTVLHLIGDRSEVASGLTIARYEWKVTGPEGVDAVFDPHADTANTTLAANAAGKYTFQLKITDSYGTETGTAECPNAEIVVNVVPCNAIHVELIWDKADAFGGSSDIDLHMLHPNARGMDIDEDGTKDGWFDDRYDVYFGNLTPDWETGSFEDDPSLDLDDTDGGGPENINLDNPVSDRTYKVGVHYWEDFGGGDTSVTVRIYIHAELVHEAKHQNLRACDLWEVAEINWPAGTVKPIRTSSGDKKIGRICSDAVNMGGDYGLF